MSAYTVLTIDDDKSARVLFDIMLKRNGFDVIQAEDADEAFSQLENFKPDLIMTDISLPGMDGIELTEVLRERPDMDHVAIIVLSAHQSEDIINQALAAGADEFFKKPLMIQDLGERLNTIIQKRLDDNP